MNKQYVEGVQKWQKDFMMMKDCKIVRAMLALLLNGRIGDIPTVQRTETEKNQSGFLERSCKNP